MTLFINKKAYRMVALFCFFSLRCNRQVACKKRRSINQDSIKRSCVFARVQVKPRLSQTSLEQLPIIAAASSTLACCLKANQERERELELQALNLLRFESNGPRIQSDAA